MKINETVTVEFDQKHLDEAAQRISEYRVKQFFAVTQFGVMARLSRAFASTTK